MNQRERDHYTPHEVAELEGVHVATIWRWAKDGLIPSWRSPGGRTIRIPRDYQQKIGAADSSARPSQSAAHT
jgi:excisionase family DNA binding protein